MQNRSNGGGFIPALENWNFDLTGNAPLFGTSQRGGRSCRGGCRNANVQPRNEAANACAANTANEGVGPAIVRCTGRADCPCETCRAQRAACAAPIAPCNACETKRPVCPTPVTPCNPCETVNNRPCGQQPVYPRPGATCPVNPCNDRPSLTPAQVEANGAAGMVYAAWQTIAETYDAHSALAAGTLYPELYKPLYGYCPTGDNCATAEQEAAFVLWELRLYLNTHPDDARALAMFNYLMGQMGENYATAFLPDCTAAWNWVDCPWPWELDANRC